MSPRIEKHARCPHCKTELGGANERVCPECGGSLQKRFLKAGCLTSAPPVFLAAASLFFGASRSDGSAERASSEAPGAPAPPAAGPESPRDVPSEATPSLQWPPAPSR